MALTYAKKQELVQSIKTLVDSSQSIIITHYQGVAVSDISALRAKAKTNGVVCKVARNTLLRLALQDSAYQVVLEEVKGPVMAIFSLEDPGAGARLAKDFAKEKESFKVVAFGLGGAAYKGSEIDRLANLPTREEALAQIAFLLKAPITNFARGLKDVPTRLVRVLAAAKDQKS